TGEQARRLRFPGSPTLRVNGADLIEQAPDDIIGLTCRLYRLSDGRPSPTPRSSGRPSSASSPVHLPLRILRSGTLQARSPRSGTLPDTAGRPDARGPLTLVSVSRVLRSLPARRQWPRRSKRHAHLPS